MTGAEYFVLAACMSLGAWVGAVSPYYLRSAWRYLVSRVRSR